MDPAEANPFQRLTRTVREVARLLAEGLTCRQVADARGVSVKTIDTQRAVALRRLGLTNNVELARLAIRWGEANNPLTVALANVQ